jgi:hypothetical protein
MSRYNKSKSRRILTVAPHIQTILVDNKVDMVEQEAPIGRQRTGKNPKLQILRDIGKGNRNVQKSFSAIGRQLLKVCIEMALKDDLKGLLTRAKSS